MTGHLGDVRRTTQNLVIVRIDAERQLLLIRGAVPGAGMGTSPFTRRSRAASRRQAGRGQGSA